MVLCIKTHSRVRVTVGTSKDFDSSVGVHHQSAPSPLGLILMMERATRDRLLVGQ